MSANEDRTPRERIALHLENANIDVDRAVNVEDGAKACFDHDDRRSPTEWTGNYGLYATARDTLVILDVDEYRDLEDGHPGLDALDKLPETLTQQSPHGGEHRIYSVTVTDDGRLPAAAFKDEIGVANPGASWGEVLVDNKYCLGAGSELDGCGKDWHDCSEPGEGRYELVNDERIAIVSVDEMVDVLLADPEITPAEPDTGGADAEYGDAVDISVHDVISATKYPEGKRREHPVHGSSSGSNFMVDEGAETWRCWRGGHDCTGNALHLIGMKAGIIECGEWTNGGLSSEIWADIFDAAREQGFDVGDASVTRDAIDEAHAETNGGTDDDTSDDTASDHAAEDMADNEFERCECGLQTKGAMVNRLTTVLWELDPPEEEDDDGITDKVAVHRVAQILTDRFNFIYPRTDVRGWRNVLYYFDHDRGVYVPQGEAKAKKVMEDHMGAWVGNGQIDQTIRKIKRRNTVGPRELEDPHPGRIVVENGILDLCTGELDDYDHDEYHRTRLDVAYDPDAECPEIDSFLHDIVNAGNVPTLYRLIAHCIYKRYTAQKAAMLVGDGENGKSVFLRLIEEFVGDRNVSGRSLQEVSENRFAMNDLHLKLANLHADMSDESVEDVSQFKQLTGGDTVLADVKHEKPIKFENYSTMIFAANGVPELPEDNHAIWRRWIYVTFPETFDGDDAVPERKLMRRLTQDEELQGLLARCVEEISAWWDGRDWFPDSPSPERTREKLKRAAEPVYDFACACLEDARDDPEAKIPKDMVREAYKEYARQEDLPMMKDNVFGEELCNIRDYDIAPGQSRAVTSGPDSVPVYNGVKLTKRGEHLLGIYDPDEEGVTQLDDHDHEPEDHELAEDESAMDVLGEEYGAVVEYVESHAEVTVGDVLSEMPSLGEQHIGAVEAVIDEQSSHTAVSDDAGSDDEDSDGEGENGDEDADAGRPDREYDPVAFADTLSNPSPHSADSEDVAGVVDVVRDRFRGSVEALTVDELVEDSAYDRGEVEDAVDELLMDGEIYESAPDEYLAVDLNGGDQND